MELLYVIANINKLHLTATFVYFITQPFIELIQ